MGRLKRFDESFGLKMLEKLDDDFAGAIFYFTMSVVNAAFPEYIAECNDLTQVLVKLDFDDPTNDVVFERDVHEAVANAGSVKKNWRVRQNLFALFGNFHKRRNAVEEDDSCVIAVDESFVKVRGQDRRIFFSFGVGIVERGIDLSVVDFDDCADKLFETQKNVLANIVRNFAFAAFGRLAGHCAVNHSERNATVTLVEIREAGTEDGVVEFVERVGVIATVVVGEVVDGNDVAVALDLFLFHDSALLAVNDHSRVLLLLKVVDDFAQLEVWNEAQFDWHDLKILFEIHEGSSFIEDVNPCCQRRR